MGQPRSPISFGLTDLARSTGRRTDDRIREAEAGGVPLQIVYRVDGSPDLTEEVLDHLERYRRSAPVRVGNDAADQLQLDIYGEALKSLHLADCSGLRTSHEGWLDVVKLVNWLCEHWDQPEDGIWETRGGRQDFTYGHLMSWVAFDRAIRLADWHGRPADTSR